MAFYTSRWKSVLKPAVLPVSIYDHSFIIRWVAVSSMTWHIELRIYSGWNWFFFLLNLENVTMKKESLFLQCMIMCKAILVFPCKFVSIISLRDDNKTTLYQHHIVAVYRINSYISTFSLYCRNYIYIYFLLLELNTESSLLLFSVILCILNILWLLPLSYWHFHIVYFVYYLSFYLFSFTRIFIVKKKDLDPNWILLLLVQSGEDHFQNCFFSFTSVHNCCYLYFSERSIYIYI